MLWGWADIAQAGQMNAADIRFQDLPPGLAQRFDRESFPGLIRAIADETARRKRDGEFDHLIAYALQSSQFTTEPKIEPAVSAKAFAQSATVPAEVRRRLQQFLHALSNPAGNPRLGYFAQLCLLTTSIWSFWKANIAA
jgi:hypothetical protein